MLDGEEGQGPHSGKFSRTHVVCVAPGIPSPLSPLFQLFFFSRIAFYVPPPFFRGSRIFFLPLGRPSAATEGAAKMHRTWRGGVEAGEDEEGCVQWDGRREMICPTWNGGCTWEGRRRMENREKIEGAPSSGGNGLRPSLRSQLVAL